MRQLCGLVMVLLVTLFSYAPTSGTEEQSNGVVSIVNRFPGYHLLRLQERNSETRAFVLRHFPRNNLSVVHADFDGDGCPDYALLLEDNKSGATKLVVLLCSGDGRCKSVYDIDVTTHSHSIYIRPVPVGSRVSQTDAIDTKDHTSPVRLNFTGIRVTYFGQAEVVLYWNKKLRKIEEIQTED